MTEKTKDFSNGILTISREELPSIMLGVLEEATEAWGDTEKLGEISGKVMDLGVAWENMKSNEEASHIMLFAGVGSSLDKDNSIFPSIQQAIETGELSEFTEAIRAIKDEIVPEATTEAVTDEDVETQEVKEETVEEATEEIVAEVEEATEEQATEEVAEVKEVIIGEVVEEAVSEEVVDTPAATTEVVTEKWSTDMSAELKQEQAKEAKESAAKEEDARKERAKSFKPDTFSWDSVTDGEFKE